MELNYRPKGVCSQMIHVEIENHIIKNVCFTGGCSGNTQGIASLVTGMNAEEAISRLQGIRCGNKPTSCPDQLAWAIRQALEQ